MSRRRIVLTIGLSLFGFLVAARAENEFTGAKCEEVSCKNLCYGDRVSDPIQCPGSKLCRLVKCTKGGTKTLLCKKTTTVGDKCNMKVETVKHDCTKCQGFYCGCSETDGDCAFAACNCNDGGVDIADMLDGATCVKS